jgi:DNA mismatch endonuclease (patch repair protein)
VRAGRKCCTTLACATDRRQRLELTGGDTFRPMTDQLSPEHRSWNMSRIRSRDTSPERAVRSLLHRLGYRFRLHRKDLPGTPDIVLPRMRVAIFVHGCFWHRHHGCKLAYTPKSNVSFWTGKFEGNVQRDAKKKFLLKSVGWRVFTVWECETKTPGKLRSRLRRRLKSVRPPQLLRRPKAR